MAGCGSTPSLNSPKMFGVVPKTIHRWIAAGDLIAHRLNRRIRVSEADLQAFILARRQG
jgi:excisionase family DNA binding protein